MLFLICYLLFGIEDQSFEAREGLFRPDYTAFSVRSPRWSSGYNSGMLYNPRMLLFILLILTVLVLEFESYRGEILNLFEKIKEGSSAESAYSVGRHNSTAVDEGRKS